MDPWPRDSFLLAMLLAAILAQASGSPTYWSQPDCYRQTMDDTATSYQDLEGPGYQETLRAMLEETVRAFCEMVRITAQAARQELVELSRIWYQSPFTSDCPPGGAHGNDQEGYHPNDSPDHMVFPDHPMDGEPSLGSSQPQLDAPQHIESSADLDLHQMNLNKINSEEPATLTSEKYDENSSPYEVAMDFGCVNGFCPGFDGSNTATTETSPYKTSTAPVRNSTVSSEVLSHSKNSSVGEILHRTTPQETEIDTATVIYLPNYDVSTATFTTGLQMPEPTAEVSTVDFTSTKEISSTTDIINPSTGTTLKGFGNKTDIFTTTASTETRAIKPTL